MNLTEPQAGSDVGALTTRAVPSDDGDGSWRDHRHEDLHHLRRAGPDRQRRAPRARPGAGRAAGHEGHLVLHRAEGARDGERNAVTCIGIEHKMGIHASPTCTMEYDGAVGWLVGGEPNRGMAQMFTMMNTARLSVGLSGLALAERAYQAARRRTPGSGCRGRARPIVEHPDVRRMLLHIRSHIEAMRALVYTNAWAIDLAKHGRDDARADAGARSSPTC